MVHFRCIVPQLKTHGHLTAKRNILAHATFFLKSQKITNIPKLEVS